MSHAPKCGLTLLLAALLAAAAAAQGTGHAPDPAHAAPAPDAKPTAHAADAHAGESHESRPILSFDPGAALWSIAVFAGLFLVLYKAAWPQILTALQTRERFIQESIDNARREREEADKLLARYRQQIDHARVEATAIVDEGRRDAEAVRRRIHDDARAEAEAMLARARREIELAAQSAMKSLYDQTADLVVQVSSRVISKSLGQDDHRRLVAEAIERIRADGAGRRN